MSELVSETPSNPDLKVTISLNCFAPIFSERERYQARAGSRSPDRVLIGTPASGVKLMLASMGLPPGRRDGPREGVSLVQTLRPEAGLRQADPVHRAVQQPS
jgi:hypothetical protein